ncbi:MAG: RNA 2',3'-cyclic phosphodiesterase [Clostridiaceae bacterium]|nr:RNA 2',3'-cyclic phosphodiesterase [Clostridiaceae bacterium]
MFYAIELDESTRSAIDQARVPLLEQSRAGKWTTPANYHLTLQFLGECIPGQLPDLHDILCRTAALQQPFCLTFQKWGAFGRHQEIVWLGVRSEPALDFLYGNLNRLLRERSCPHEDRPYCPHMTLGRQVRLDDGVMKNLPEFSARMMVDHLALMESTRLNGQLVYRAVYREPLSMTIHNK